MRRLITSGVAPCDAAVKAKAFKGQLTAENLVEEFEVRQDVVDSLHRAAKSLDQNFVETLLRKDISDYGVIASWTEVIVPLLFLVGDEWAATGTGIEVEHMLSEIIKRLLSEGVAEIKEPVNSQPVLLASVGEEVHCLAIHALAAALAERKIETFFLGARTPLEAISGMVKRSAPPAVFLWAQLEQNSDPKFFKELPVVRPAPRLIVGGPGITDCP